jgi:predicted lipoprotein with Yx(FWY)xxD motif
MKNVNFVLTALTALMLLVTACAPAATPTAIPPTEAPTMAPAPTAMPAGAAANVSVAKNDAFGSFLVDDKGMTLYLFTKDTPNASNCYDKCATAWPPLLTTGAPVGGNGIDASKLGTTKRTDGSMQVTYAGWPLYYYVKDTKPGDVVGQDVGKVWFLISPAGAEIAAQAAVVPVTGGSGAANVMVGKNDKLGSFLVDNKGMSLYLFTKDTPNTSNCYDKCATAWPPLLTTGAPVAGTGVDTSKLGTTKRTDGSTQITYNGWPLYYYVKDSKPGDVVGQGVGDVWYVISPDGTQITTY